MQKVLGLPNIEIKLHYVTESLFLAHFGNNKFVYAPLLLQIRASVDEPE